MVSFDPSTCTFELNESHEIVKAFADDSKSRLLLEDLVTAEVFLEVYMLDYDIPIHAIEEILARRDSLFRSLAKDHSFSTALIAQRLRRASEDQHDLEVALVLAMRSLGFVVSHISNSGEPDGLARFTDATNEEQQFTLEAKSSASPPPELSAIDFAGLKEHREHYRAAGTLLLAPSYPGLSKGNDSSAANRARSDRISCWSIEQLAKVVESAEKRHISAKQIISIITEKFTPQDVKDAVGKLLAEPHWDNQELYRGTIKAIEDLSLALSKSIITIDHIESRLVMEPEFRGITKESIEDAIRQLSSVSKGGMTSRDQTVHLHVSLEELRRRISAFVPASHLSRQASTFRDTDVDTSLPNPPETEPSTVAHLADDNKPDPSTSGTDAVRNKKPKRPGKRSAKRRKKRR